MRSKLFFTILAVAAESFVTGARAESPAPVIVQTQTVTAATPVSSSSVHNDSTQSAIKLLQEIKATNDETLKKQQAALDALDELQKAAEQIKIFSKRG